jgi:hypothetical protein
MHLKQLTLNSHDALSTAPARSKSPARLGEIVFAPLPIGVSDTSNIIHNRPPFPKSLDGRVCRIPEGFRELALAGLLSVQVIERLSLERHQIVQLASRSMLDRDYSKSLRQRFTPLERVVWQGFSSFYLCTATHQVDREELAEAFLTCMRSLAENSKAERDCLLWAACVVATTRKIENWDFTLRAPVTKRLMSDFNMELEDINAICAKFLWNDAMLTSLTAVLHYHSEMPTSTDEGKRTDWDTWL